MSSAEFVNFQYDILSHKIKQTWEYSDAQSRDTAYEEFKSANSDPQKIYCRGSLVNGEPKVDFSKCPWFAEIHAGINNATQ